MFIGVDGISLVHGGTSDHLLLLGGEEKLVSFVGLGGEVARVRQESGEVNHIFINQHAGYATGVVLTKGLLNN